MNDVYNIQSKLSYKERLAALKPKKRQLEATWNKVWPVARYAIALRGFWDAVTGMFILAAVAAVAISYFTWATSRVRITNPIFQAPPSPVSITLTEAGRRALGSSLGEACVQQPSIQGILLSVDGGKFEVVTIPSTQCQVAKFTVDVDTGTVAAAGLTSTPTPTAAGTPTPGP